MIVFFFYLKADKLRALAEQENNNTRTQHAYSAASAYSSIVQEIQDAKRASEEAEEAVATVTNIVCYCYCYLKELFSLDTAFTKTS